MKPAVVIGAASAVAFCVGAALGGGSATIAVPRPTPQIVTTTRVVEIPAPVPTPLTITRSVEVKVATPVTPPECLAAMDAGDAVITAFSDFLDAMVNERWKKADAATTASAEAMEDWYDASVRCRLAESGS